jgi:hypothetical protein
MFYSLAILLAQTLSILQALEIEPFPREARPSYASFQRNLVLARIRSSFFASKMEIYSKTSAGFVNNNFRPIIAAHTFRSPRRVVALDFVIDTPIRDSSKIGRWYLVCGLAPYYEVKNFHSWVLFEGIIRNVEEKSPW